MRRFLAVFLDQLMRDRAAKVTRFELIDDTGRVYSLRPCRVEWSYQDDGRTLKVFVTRDKGMQKGAPN